MMIAAAAAAAMHTELHSYSLRPSIAAIPPAPASTRARTNCAIADPACCSCSAPPRSTAPCAAEAPGGNRVDPPPPGPSNRDFMIFCSFRASSCCCFCSFCCISRRCAVSGDVDGGAGSSGICSSNFTPAVSLKLMVHNKVRVARPDRRQ